MPNPRPTPATLTTAGFSAAPGSTTKYIKSNTTAVATVELATGGSTSGFASITQATPGSSIAAADWAAHVALLGTFGLTVGASEDHGPGLVAASQSV